MEMKQVVRLYWCDIHHCISDAVYDVPVTQAGNWKHLCQYHFDALPADIKEVAESRGHKYVLQGS